MNLPKTLLAVCSTDATRPLLRHVYVDVKEKVAVACNGASLLMLPIVPEEGEISGYVPTEAILHAAKQPKSLRGRLVHLDKVTMVAGIAFPNPFAEDATPPRYPDWKGILPTTRPPARISLNAELLVALARGLSAQAVVTLCFEDITSPITVINPLTPIQGMALLSPYTTPRALTEGSNDAHD